MDNQNQYNFIMEPGSNQSSGPAFLRDPKKRILFAGAFVVIVLMIVMVVAGSLLSLGNKSSAGLKDLVAYQTEILRVSEIGLKDSKDLSVKAKIGTIQSFTASDLNKTKALVDGDIEKFELAKFQDSNTDKALSSALASNNFDSEIIEQLDNLFSSYQNELKKVYESSSDEEDKLILNTANENIVIYEGL
jgi:hypothetical protein